MSDVVDITEYKRKKDKKKEEPQRFSNHSYTGKLAEAMKKFGSFTGNLQKNKKEEEKT